MITYLCSSARSVSPSLDELKHFSKHLERRMSRLIMVKNAGILSLQDKEFNGTNSDQVFQRICVNGSYCIIYNKGNFCVFL